MALFVGTLDQTNELHTDRKHGGAGTGDADGGCMEAARGNWRMREIL